MSGSAIAEGPAEPDDLAVELDRLRAENAAAKAECERLTFELGHRVKNTLSMVQALANQTFRGAASTDQALQVFGDRILALARANDVILAESWTQASLATVAACVLSPGGQPLGPVTIEGPPQRMGAGSALAFALALHELATNARRHGAWQTPAGHVALIWRLRDEAGVPRLDLSWTETGGPPASTPQKRGFGLRLAEQSLRSAFGRDVVFDFRPPGFTCRISALPATIEE